MGSATKTPEQREIEALFATLASMSVRYNLPAPSLMLRPEWRSFFNRHMTASSTGVRYENGARFMGVGMYFGRMRSGQHSFEEQ